MDGEINDGNILVTSVSLPAVAIIITATTVPVVIVASSNSVPPPTKPGAPTDSSWEIPTSAFLPRLNARLLLLLVNFVLPLCLSFF